MLDVSPFFDEAAYRVLYARGLDALKAVATAAGIWRRMRDLIRARHYDLVLVYRESAPLGPPLFERWLSRRRIPYVYDFDDALFLGPIHPVNARWRWLRSPGRYAESARGAAAVTTVNEYLAAWARRLCTDVTVIPTPVDTDRFRPRPTHHDVSPVVIGWTGSSTTAPYLDILKAPLATLSRRRRLTMTIVGAPYAHPNVPVRSVPWSFHSEPNEVSRFDVGVLPEPDDAWTKGKGAFKAIVYMAAGVPVVASRVGVNEAVIPHGRAGLCVTSEDEWVDALERLTGDASMRERFGRAGRAWVEERYSVAAQTPHVAEVLWRAAGRL